MKKPNRHKQPFVFNNYVRPVQSPSSCALPRTYCKVSGWGSLREGGRSTSDQLQSVAIPILSIATWDYADSMNTETMLAAGFWEGGKGMALS